MPWLRHYNLFVLNRPVITQGARDGASAILYLGFYQNVTTTSTHFGLFGHGVSAAANLCTLLHDKELKSYARRTNLRIPSQKQKNNISLLL